MSNPSGPPLPWPPPPPRGPQAPAGGWPAYGDQWLPPGPPQRRGLGRAGAAVLVALVTTLLGNLGAIGVIVNEAPAPSRQVSRLSPAERQAAARRELDRLMPELTRFVEEERGLKFRERVAWELLDDDEFLDELYDDDESDDDTAVDAPDEFDATLAALRLVDEDEDLDETAEDLTDAGVLGFYDFEEEALFIRGDDVNPLVRTTVVHELVHALQDQHFDLDRPGLDDLDSDQYAAWQALIEGDATVVEDAYRDSLSRREERELEDLEEDLYAGTGDSDGAAILSAFYGFPYAVGPDFVDTLLDEGQDRLDAAFRSPPRSTEDVFYPEAYLETEPITPPPAPTVPGRVVDEDVLGELGLYLWLNDGDPEGDFDDPVYWAGDRYRTWRQGDRLCTTVAIVFESADARRDLERLFAEHELGRGGGVRADGPTGLTVTSCAG